MICSFSFRGKDINEIGLNYAPDNSNTYIYSRGETLIHDETFEGHDGGYLYGTSIAPKTFVLRCYYENENVLDGLMTRIGKMFPIGKHGKLVFTTRPWLYYIASVINVDTSRMINKKNGFVTITLKAYYPYGRTDETYIRQEAVGDKVMDGMCSYDLRENSGLFEANINPPTEMTEIPSVQPILLYNGGTERACVTVDIAGDVGKGVTIYNATTKQEMKFIGLNSGSEQKYVECDGLTGNCYWVSNDSDNGKNAFLYHSQGYIELEPGYPLKRDVAIITTQSSNVITMCSGEFEEEDIGKYIYADGKFRKIASISEDENGNFTKAMVTTNCTNNTEVCDAVIAQMNEIYVTPDTTMNLTFLAFKYKHTFA